MQAPKIQYICSANAPCGRPPSCGYMLTIAQTAKHFNLPKNFIRQAVLDGRIVHVKAGKKHLINIQKVEEWLNAGDNPSPQKEQAQTGGIQ